MYQHNNINNDNLNGLPKQHPFGTDSDYFSKLNDRIIERVNEFEELNDIAPTLNKIPKYNPFSVPANYFESFPTVIQTAIATNKKQNNWIEWIILLIKPSFAVPVLSVLLITFIGIKNIDKIESKDTVTYDSYSIYDELENIDESIIIEEVIQKISTPEATNNEIEEYLIENEIEELN